MLTRAVEIIEQAAEELNQATAVTPKGLVDFQKKRVTALALEEVNNPDVSPEDVGREVTRLMDLVLKAFEQDSEYGRF